LLIALGLLLVTVLPLSYSFRSEQRLCRAYYYRAIAMEVVDGELETLVAGEWRAYAPGTHDYQPRAECAANLPRGRFVLTVNADRVRLEWRPAKRAGGGTIVREARIR
jgi:hypothetical protein